MLVALREIRYGASMIVFALAEVLFLGFLCGLIPGPVVTAIFTEAIRRGPASARRIVLLSAAGELVMSVICVTALSFLSPTSPAFSVLGLFGSLLLMGIGWDLWRLEEIAEEEPLFSSRRIILISLLNGMAWIFWITVCAPQAMALELRLSGGKWLFILLFELGWLAAAFGLAYLFGFFRPFFQGNKNLRILYRTIAILFVLFAVKLATGSIQALLNS